MTDTRDWSDREAAEALVELLPEVRWEAVALAHGYLRLSNGASVDDAARLAYQKGMSTLKQSRKLLGELGDGGFTTLLRPREKRGSAENPIPKMFPATVSEERFLELVDQLCDDVNGLSISDEREVGHGLSDFTLVRGEQQLPINIKNAGTRFERSAELVGLEPDDCIPIPAYKAHEPVR